MICKNDKICFLDVDGVLNCCTTKDRCCGYVGIDDKKVSCFSFNPEKNKDLGGQYDIVFQGGTTAWVWELSNKGLEKLNAALQQNISLAQKQAKARSNGVKM